MLAIFGKKKISENKTANIFVNGLLNLIEQGFDEVCAQIEEDPEFYTSPQISRENIKPFLLTVFAANLCRISEHYSGQNDERLIDLSIEKMAMALGIDKAKFSAEVQQYRKTMSRINHPSKNTLLGMAKLLFVAYDLNRYQIPFYRDLNTPNPLFIKRLKELLAHFEWDWQGFNERYKVV